MTKHFLMKMSILLLMLLSSLLSSQTLDFLWTQQIGGELDDEGTSVTVDNMNNYYTTGWFNDTAIIGDTVLSGNGDNDIVIAKYDEEGNLLWAKAIGGTGSDKAHSITTDGSEFFYLTGEFSAEVYFDSLTSLTGFGSKDIFLAKFNLEGEVIWARKAGGSGFDAAYDLEIDSEENIILIGRFYGSALFEETTITGNGSWDIF